jgi:ubiquinone/menaquinone biosynthesis C-methylase UbiE
MKTKTQENSDYIMESPSEAKRLEYKTDEISVEKQLRFTDLATTNHVLEVGCGTGAVTRILAKIACDGKVLGVDSSATRVSEAKKLAEKYDSKASFLQADASKLPFEDNTFDFTCARMLFEYLSAPELVLAEMIRVTRPEGTIMISDLDGQIVQWFPLPEHLTTALEEGLALLKQSGFDPFVGRKLFYWLKNANINNIKVHVQPYQVYSGELSEHERNNWKVKFDTTAQKIGHITGEPQKWQAMGDEIFSEIQKENIFYYCTLIQVHGKK